MKNNLHIVMYHYVRDIKNSRYPLIKGLDYKLFRDQVDFFRQKFNIVTMEEVIAAYEESYDLPDNAMLLTFDDGYIDHYKYVYPILDEYKLQGSFFVPGKIITEHTLLNVNKIHFILAACDTHELLGNLFEKLDFYRGENFSYDSNEVLFNNYAIANRYDSKEVIFMKRIMQTVLPEKLRNIITDELFESAIGLREEVFASELYLNADQIRCMKRNGMFIGVHGYDHYWLANLDDESIKNDIDKALECMDEFIDLRKWVMNYPYGSQNERVVKIAQAMGCCLGLTTEVRICNINKDCRYTLPRLDTNDYPPKSDNYLQLGVNA